MFNIRPPKLDDIEHYLSYFKTKKAYCKSKNDKWIIRNVFYARMRLCNNSRKKFIHGHFKAYDDKQIYIWKNVELF